MRPHLFRLLHSPFRGFPPPISPSLFQPKQQQQKQKHFDPPPISPHVERELRWSLLASSPRAKISPRRRPKKASFWCQSLGALRGAHCAAGGIDISTVYLPPPPPPQILPATATHAREEGGRHSGRRQLELSSCDVHCSLALAWILLPNLALASFLSSLPCCARDARVAPTRAPGRQLLVVSRSLTS